MGHDPRRITHKLVAVNGRGQVLGVVIVDNCEESHEARCNDCDWTSDGHDSLAYALAWIEMHEHRSTGETLPTISTERDDDGCDNGGWGDWVRDETAAANVTRIDTFRNSEHAGR